MRTVEQILQQKLHEQMRFNTTLMDEIQELRLQVKAATPIIKQYRELTARQSELILKYEQELRQVKQRGGQS